MHLTATDERCIVVTANRLVHFRCATGWTFADGIALPLIVCVGYTHAASWTDHAPTRVILSFYDLDKSQKRDKSNKQCVVAQQT